MSQVFTQEAEKLIENFPDHWKDEWRAIARNGETSQNLEVDYDAIILRHPHLPTGALRVFCRQQARLLDR